MSQGQGHETTFAQLVAHELGIGVDEVEVVQGDTDRTPFGLGTYGSRSTPVSGAATVVAARKVRERARLVAAAMLEVAPQDLEWVAGRFQVRGVPGTGASFREIAMAAHSDLELPDGVEGHLDATAVYNPPNLTFPCGAYVCVVEVDAGTGQVAVRRFVAVDDCGVRINPTIVEGQIHGGLADGVGMALMELIAFDRDGQPPGRLVHGLPAADRAGVPDVGAGGDGHALAAPPGRGQGRGGVGDRRLARRRRQRRARRDRGAARRHAAHPGAGVAGGPGAPAAAGPRDRRRAVRADLLARVDGLRTRRTPFVLATVVRAERPTSAKPGDCAVVTADGTLDGFVGGVCAESTVRVESLRLLAAGESELLRITPDAGAAPAQDGVRTVGNPCLSGGTLEIFLEAMIPPMLVAVFGESPVARALVRVGAALDWDVRTGLDPLTPGHVGRGRGVARARRARRPPRGPVGRGGLHRAGREQAAGRRRARRARRHRGRARAASTPRPGLDIGARSAAEIALSVCAGIVAARPRVARVPDAPAPPGPAVAVDPVCGMEVLVEDGALQAGDVYFCGPGCLAAWQARATR